MIEWGESYFSKQNIDSPKKTIEWIIRQSLGYDRLSLYTKYDRPFTETELDSIRAMVKRRAAGEPLQYILGSWDFYGLNLKCDQRALIPRPETEDMVHQIVMHYQQKKLLPGKIIDVGTGTGAIALALAKEFKESKVVGVDISADAIELAKFNSIRNKVDNVEFYQADMLSVIPNGKYDLVVSNPPYISAAEYQTLQREIKYYEPQSALTDFSDGFIFYKRFVTIFRDIVSDEGEMWLEFGKDQEYQIENLITTNYLSVDFYKDSQRIVRFCKIRMKNN